MDLLRRVVGRTDEAGCGCEPTFEDDGLVLEAGDCEGRGDLAAEPACRATAIGALTRQDADAVVVRTGGTERAYTDRAVALLVAAGRFAERVAFHDERLAHLARWDPLRAARDATARASPVCDVAAETGLAAVAEDAWDDRPPTDGGGVVSDPSTVGGRRSRPDGGAPTGEARGDARYRRALRAHVGPTVAHSRVALHPQPGARLVGVRELDTGALARVYEHGGRRRYHLEPPELRLDADALATLAAAHERLADGDPIDRSRDGQYHPDTGGTGGSPDRAAGRAVRAVADEDDPVEALTAALRKHTRGYGVLADLFADPQVSDVYATAPVDETPLRVVLDDQTVPSNVTLTSDGARALASRLRRESGRSFSRASPTLDATADVGGGVRAAGVTDPVSDGVAFAFRDDGREAWTLPALVENDTLPVAAAAFLSVAVERAGAVLVAGPRGAGKTTTLGALLWELPPSTRTVVIEDTPELPVGRLLESGRDVQGLRAAPDEGPEISPVEALRTALRLGEGALVLGEVRGEEARTLYEAMRVGASDSAVLGTIHGDGADAVRERVVSDLSVPASSFAATDLVVSVAPVETPAGRDRRVVAVEEVVGTAEGVRFATLFDLDGTDLAPTGRIERGNSRVAGDLASPGESYADLLDAVENRRGLLADLVADGRTDPADVTTAYANRGSSR